MNGIHEVGGSIPPGSTKFPKVAGGAGMTSDSDDLEEALRENLKLRRELASNVAKAEAASQRGGAAYRLGWVLYWSCLVLAALAVLYVGFVLWADGALFSLRLAVSAVAVLLLYGLGRAVRYVLSGE